MLIIYGANLSAPANKIRFVANALGLEYEYQKVNLRQGENKQDWFLKLHPAGKIPVIDDDGFVLFESNAIIKYLAQKHKSVLYPSGLKERAAVDQWMDFVSLHIGAAMGRVLYNRVFAPIIGTEVDQRSLKDGVSFLGRFLPVVDRQLKNNEYLAGSEMTLADFVLLATLDPTEVAGIDVSSYPKIVRWRQKLMEQEFYTKCHKSYGEALAALQKA
jgi:glutathione S-transferase